MNHFSVALKKLCNSRLQQDIAEATGIPRSTINQYILGTRAVSVQVLDQLFKAFNEAEQKKLLLAYLKSETPESWFGRVSITFRDKNTQANPETDAILSDKKLSAAIEILKHKAANNENVRQVVLDLGVLLS